MRQKKTKVDLVYMMTVTSPCPLKNTIVSVHFPPLSGTQVTSSHSVATISKESRPGAPSPLEGRKLQGGHSAPSLQPQSSCLQQ